MSNTKQKFYLTTPIYYVNARPHIGHAYTTIAADVIARRHRLLGDDTFFLTGTDEHGQKIERSAAAAGIPPQQFADQVSAQFESLWKRMGMLDDSFSKNDPLFHRDYIRTTEPRHKQGAQKLFALLQKNGFIELRAYTGQYCISDETFVDVPVGAPCPECGRITETVTEENYFFELSAFQRPLIDLIESEDPDNRLHIQPDSRKNEVLSFLRGPVDHVLYETTGDPNEKGSIVDQLEREKVAEGSLDRSNKGKLYVPGALKDLSISRSSFKWGIPVPGDEKHVIYVWLDALANYMTAIGYGSEDPIEQEKFKRYWPADLHLVGKEIIRFHCVYWPAFLLALNPALMGKKPEDVSFEVHSAWAKQMLPKAITAHGWLLFEDSKMSKSRGNIVRTETILDAFGTLLQKPAEISGTSGGSTGLQPGESTPQEKGALAPGLSTADAAWKHEQDLFAADVLRYFLLREIPFGQDGSFSFDALVQRYNSDLANGYGNLVSRTLTMIENFLQGEPCKQNALTIQNFPIGSSLLSEPISFEPNDLTKTTTTIISYVASLDRHLSEKAPWKLAKKDDQHSRFDLEEALYGVAESIRIITALLYPILPYATSKVWTQLGLGDIEADAKAGKLKDLQWGGLKPGTKLGPLSPIFPRADKGLIQIMTDMETPKPEPSKLIGEKTAANAIPADPTHPAAPPRTSTFSEPNPGAQVGGAAAPHPDLVQTPPHTEAPASAPFAASAAASTTPDTPQIAIDDFVKIDLRVAKIVVAERIPKADKLLRLEVDLGYETRQILSGIAQWYTPEELIGRKIVVIANLAPRKMRGLESHGMLLAASHGEDGKPVLATFGEDIALGSRLK